MVILYVVIALGGPYAEAIIAANDLEQAQGRVFEACRRIVLASPLLRNSARITASTIAFTSTGSTITAIAADAASASGSNPTAVCFDELWAYTSERSRRLWDEVPISPARKVSVRLTTTYAGYSGESELLEALYQRGLRGVQIAPDLYAQKDMLMFWSARRLAPWQSEGWLESMRESERPTAFRRMYLNEFVAGESEFVPLEAWDACVEPMLRPVVSDRNLDVWAGVDASVKHDSTAIVATTFDQRTRQVRLVLHRIFQPSRDNPIDFEFVVERCLLELHRSFRVREVKFDPYQLIGSAQRLTRAGVPMVEFAQSVPNLTEASNNLYELIKAKNLVLYPSAEMRLAVSHTVAFEGARGWRLAKERASHKIDCIVALAQACLGAVRQSGAPGPMTVQTLSLSTPMRVIRGPGVPRRGGPVTFDPRARFNAIAPGEPGYNPEVHGDGGKVVAAEDVRVKRGQL